MCFHPPHVKHGGKFEQEKGHDVTTLALGLRPTKGLARVWAKSEARESHLMLPGV
jgi:hypothetical protein